MKMPTKNSKVFLRHRCPFIRYLHHHALCWGNSPQRTPGTCAQRIGDNTNTFFDSLSTPISIPSFLCLQSFHHSISNGFALLSTGIPRGASIWSSQHSLQSFDLCKEPAAHDLCERELCASPAFNTIFQQDHPTMAPDPVRILHPRQPQTTGYSGSTSGGSGSSSGDQFLDLLSSPFKSQVRSMSQHK